MATSPTKSQGEGGLEPAGPGRSRSPEATLCHVLTEDPDLASAIAPSRRDAATAECITRSVQIPRGRWPATHSRPLPDGIGLLMLQGLVMRRVGIDGRFGAELLGAGDILRPWEGRDTFLTMPRTTGWRVLEATRVAVLDRLAAQRFARYPELTGPLVGRALQRSRNLAVNMAIVHQARVDVRLQMLFWHIADRWGRVVPGGIRLPIRLTHADLADLVAARRPTVSSALSELTRRELVRNVDNAWLLTGNPPGELTELGAGTLSASE